MWRAKKALKKLLKYWWVLLLSLPTRLFEDRIVGGLNRFLDARYGAAAIASLNALHWLMRTGFGVSGAFITLVALGLMLYAYVETNPKFDPRKKPSKKTPLQEEPFVDRVILPPIMYVGVLALIIIPLLTVFKRDRTFLTMMTATRHYGADGAFTFNVRYRNTGTVPAAQARGVCKAYLEPNVSTDSAKDAREQFADYWRKQKEGPLKGRTFSPLGVGGEKFLTCEGVPATQENVEKIQGKAALYAVLVLIHEDDAGYHETFGCFVDPNSPNDSIHYCGDNRGDF